MDTNKYLIIDEVELTSKYARKKQNHDKNIELKKQIIRLLNHEQKIVKIEYRNRNEANYYRTVTLKFLKMLKRQAGIDARINNTTLIVERFKL